MLLLEMKELLSRWNHDLEAYYQTLVILFEQPHLSREQKVYMKWNKDEFIHSLFYSDSCQVLLLGAYDTRGNKCWQVYFVRNKTGEN